MLRRMSFFIRIFLSLTAVIVTAIAVPAYYFSVSMQENFLEDTKAQSFRQLELMSLLFDFEPKHSYGNFYENVYSDTHIELEKKLEDQNLRITLFQENGDVLYDSSVEKKEIANMDNHGDRIEFKEAKATGKGFSLRFSNTLGIDFIYVAMPLDGGAILRLALPYENFAKRIESLFGAVAFVFTLGILIALLLAFGLSYGIKRQLKKMLTVIEAISLGKYESRLHHVPGQEFAVLAQAVNRMAENIEAQLAVMREQSAQLEVIFNTIQSAILLLDNNGNIRHTNKALRALAPCLQNQELCNQDVMPEDVRMQVIECIASPVLQNTVDRILKGEKNSQGFQNIQDANDTKNTNDTNDTNDINDIKDRNDTSDSRELNYYLELELFPSRHFSVYLAKPEKATESMGLVILIQEITEIVRLETVRKDFVANVSHELRTPLTAIQGYAETIESMPELSDDCRRFAQIIHKHGSYLNVMVEDLLSLARIENEKEAFVLSAVSPLEAFHTAVGFCHRNLKNNDLTLCVDIPEDLILQANLPHLERVFRNLLENACRYALPQSDILVSAKVQGSECEFMIQNRGVFIAPEDIERIFERFYRVEKSRSSTSGAALSGSSTGLGLAICKHIVERHGGTIRAESTHHETYSETSFIFTLSHVDSSHGINFSLDMGSSPD